MKLESSSSSTESQELNGICHTFGIRKSRILDFAGSGSLQ
jgi:hypothetical protein